jgi:hypothetical protein
LTDDLEVDRAAPFLQPNREQSRILMMTGRIGVGFLIVLLMLLETFPLVAGAGENSSDAGTNVIATRLIQRMDSRTG